MAFRLKQIELTATGREIVRESTVDKPALSVGRAAENDIHLPDLAVEPRHATIALGEGGRVEVAATGSLGFGLDGGTVTEARIDAGSGAELRFGSYRVTVSREADGAVLLAVRQLDDAGAAAADLDEKRGFSLLSVLPGKRIVSWGLAALIVVAFLAVPIISNLTRSDGPGDTVVGDSSWSPGELSLVHHSLEEKCEACHVRPFESVRDKTCLGCHESAHDHASPERIARSLDGRPLGAQMLSTIGHAFGKEGPNACADCHVEHEGEQRVALPTGEFCVGCHVDLKEQLPDTRLGDASDFGLRHPQFTPAVVIDPETRLRKQVSLDAKPRENSGLAFPHKLHLDPEGGVARMAANIGRQHGYGGNGLACKDCHRPTEDGIRFLPINMERDCEACHSLAYDEVGGIFRRLHHGDVAQMVADLSVANLKQPLAPNRKRPGSYGDDGIYQFNFSAGAYRSMLIGKALSRKGICGECHTPTMNNGRPGVVPVTIVSRHMEQGWFDHKAHSQEECSSCHAAAGSTTSADLLLPGIKQCRTCHLGPEASEAKVPSGCAMCHSYHPEPFGKLAEN
ncbi:MAG: cytochrome c3 family protein [Novosphingobium sp.]|nr:cytochrome c3 family protein [Novosphingobium sp.]MCP5402216.1 cytochrome c3 family protein [Novosphingobium sp.]